jgi:hypothetical protein
MVKTFFCMFLKDNFRSRGDACRGVGCSYSWSLAGGAPPSLGREEPPRAPPRPRPRPPPRPRPRPRNPPRPEPPRPRPLPRYPPDRGLGAPSSSVPCACSRFTSSAESPDCSEQSFIQEQRFFQLVTFWPSSSWSSSALWSFSSILAFSFLFVLNLLGFWLFLVLVFRFSSSTCVNSLVTITKD